METKDQVRMTPAELAKARETLIALSAPLSHALGNSPASLTVDKKQS